MSAHCQSLHVDRLPLGCSTTITSCSCETATLKLSAVNCQLGAADFLLGSQSCIRDVQMIAELAHLVVRVDLGAVVVHVSDLF